jgi:hypothetical protein
MSITDKSSGSPPERYYTTAPKDYDWGWTKTLIENAGKDDRGSTIRLVEISDGYHADFQVQRYGSGNFATMTVDHFKKAVASGCCTETVDEKQIITISKDFDLTDLVKKTAQCPDFLTSLVFSETQENGITLSFQSDDNGTNFRYSAHGPRGLIIDKFNEEVAKIETIIKGE